jgi:hypothetical protein
MSSARLQPTSEGFAWSLATSKLVVLEAKLVAHLVRLAPAENAALLSSLDGARVREMNDGGRDLDGVPVSSTLNLDDLGDLYELHIFKGDFGKPLAFPTIEE